MKFPIAKSILTIALSAFLLSSCGDTNETTDPQTPAGYALLTYQDGPTASGYITPLGSDVPSGSISNVKTNSKQGLEMYGVRTFGKSMYRFTNFAGEAGIQKIGIDANNAIVDQGFIACGSTDISGSGQHVIVDATTGFYWDPNLGLLKVQKFNPTTMQRTGELDFTAQLTNAAQSYVSLGQNILMVKEGKLYANIHYGTTALKGFIDGADGIIRLAVIDIATGKLDKVITFDTGYKRVQVGWFIENAMWDLADDGNLYFCNLGSIGAGGSSLHRIKKGETEIDPAWRVNMEDITKNGFFHNILVRGGKIYTRIPTEGIKPDFSNIAGEIWNYATIDVNTKAVQNIAGVPTVTFNGNANVFSLINNEVYLLVVKNSQKINGYYKVNGNAATSVFNVTEGGNVSGLAVLN